MLMYIYSLNDNVRYIGERQTRQADNVVFKTETKIGTKYKNSPFYRGTKLWSGLSRDVQFSENKWAFKTHILKLYKTYEQLV